MHIAFLTPEYPHSRVFSSAGIGSSIKNLALALASRGILVSVFVYGQKEDAVFSENRIKFHLIRQRKFPLAGWYLHRKFLQNYLNKYVIVDKIDAIEAPDWTGITAFMKLRCPLVIRMHGSDAYFCTLEGRPQKKKNFWFEKLALEAADRLLSVSEFTAKETATIFGLKTTIEVIPNSVDTDYFFPVPGQMRRNELLYFGSLIRKKGVLELAKIYNNLVEQRPELRLLLLGKDVRDIYEDRSTLEIFREELTPAARQQVQHIPTVPYEKVKGYIASAEVIVLPSLAEALPMTWLEAMAMEKALVTSNIGWAKEIIDDGKTGLTEDPANHRKYANKILRLLDHPEFAERVAKEGRKQVISRFSTGRVVQENLDFYYKLVGRD